MTVQEIMNELQSKSSESVKKALLNHGVKEPLFGVNIFDLKLIQKMLPVDYQLAKDLYATGNADAMYLAGLIADDKKMTRADLQNWAEQAVSSSINEFTVPWVAAGNPLGYELALEWIDSKAEHIAATGWSTLNNIVALTPDSDLDLPALKTMVQRIIQNIHTSDNRVRYAMNSLIMSIGLYVAPLSDDALAAAKKIGTITIDRNGTPWTAPNAVDYILKIREMGAIGNKRKIAKF